MSAIARQPEVCPRDGRKVARLTSATRPTPEQVFRDHGPRVYRLAWRMLGHGPDAEDVAQEVMLQVVRKLATFRGEADLPTWLHRVTVNAALAYRRKRASWQGKVLPGPVEDWLDGGRRALGKKAEALPPDRLALQKERVRVLDRAVAGLPEIYRSVYFLSEVEGLSGPAIGRRLGMSLPAVKSRLYRGRSLLRHALASYFEATGV